MKKILMLLMALCLLGGCASTYEVETRNGEMFTAIGEPEQDGDYLVYTVKGVFGTRKVRHHSDEIRRTEENMLPGLKCYTGVCLGK